MRIAIREIHRQCEDARSLYMTLSDACDATCALELRLFSTVASIAAAAVGVGVGIGWVLQARIRQRVSCGIAWQDAWIGRHDAQERCFGNQQQSSG